MHLLCILIDLDKVDVVKRILSLGSYKKKELRKWKVIVAPRRKRWLALWMAISDKFVIYSIKKLVYSHVLLPSCLLPSTLPIFVSTIWFIFTTQRVSTFVSTVSIISHMCFIQVIQVGWYMCLPVVKWCLPVVKLVSTCIGNSAYLYVKVDPGFDTFRHVKKPLKTSFFQKLFFFNFWYLLPPKSVDFRVDRVDYFHTGFHTGYTCTHFFMTCSSRVSTFVSTVSIIFIHVFTQVIQVDQYMCLPVVKMVPTCHKIGA